MKALLQTKGLTKSYGSHKALQDVDMVIEPGKITGLLGPNGSGKTTLLKIMSGLLQPTAGIIEYPHGKARGIEARQTISLLPDAMQFPSWMKVDDAFRFYKDHYPDYSAERANAMRNLLELKDISGKKIRSLSKGMQERVALALSLSRKTDLYLLDEPLGGIDPVGKEKVIEALLTMQLGESSILISTHLVKDVEKIFDNVHFLSKGKIIFHGECDVIREQTGNTVEQKYLEVFSYVNTN